MRTSACICVHLRSISPLVVLPFRVFVISSAFLGVLCSQLAADETEVVRQWEFKTPADATGWTAANQLKDMAVIDGALRMTMTGVDAFLTAPPIEAPLDGIVIRIRMRSDREGYTQVYWTTPDYPNCGEQQMLVINTSVTAPDKPLSAMPFVTYDFPIGKLSDQGRKLIGFRIDPVNGNSDGTVEIQSVEVLRPAPVLDVNFSPASHWVEVRKPVLVRLNLRQVAGRAVESEYYITLPGGRKLTARPGKDAPQPAVEVSPDRPGVHEYRATIAGGNDQPLYDLETSLIAGKGDTLPTVGTVGSDQVHLDLIPTPDGKAVGAARWSATVKPGEWKLAGWLLPLARFTYERQPGQIVRREPALSIKQQSNDGFLLEGSLDDEDRCRVQVRFVLHLDQPRHQISVHTELRGGAGILPAFQKASDATRVLDFIGPIVRIDRDPPGDPLARYALFGGLEFLEPGWPSSSDRAVGERFAARWSPAPYKITLPAMAVEAAGLTTAVLWQPARSPDDLDVHPWATFASPNFLDGQPNHLMELSMPTALRLRQENESRARQPIPMQEPDFRPSWSYVLHAEPALPVAMIARRWYETFEAPPPAAPPRNDKDTYNLIARNFGETVWWPEEKAWRSTWYHSETKSSYHPDIAAELVAHAAVTGDQRWVKATGLEGRSIIDAAGTLAGRLAGSEAQARNLIASMRPDGTWPFVNTPELREQTRKLTNGKYDSLGEDGSTSLGTCVQPALPILRYAELTGDAKCTEAGLKALEAMRRFRIPRGAQVWEVHQEIPDIRAAALAVEAYQIGYRLTGDKNYLEDASYWAWAGVPFVYSWREPVERIDGRMIASRDKNDRRTRSLPASEGFQQPKRRIMPYATVPVMGPTFYVVNWFGVIVQWCGMEWAQKVIDLDADRPDPLLRYIADGVVLSGLQQMFDKPPWVGLYPDVWNLEQNLACGAFIYSGIPLRCLQAQGRVPQWTRTWTRILTSDNGRLRWHVSGWGKAPDLRPPNATAWSVRLTYPAGQATELLIAGTEAPSHVLIDGDVLERYPAVPPPAKPGWQYIADKRVLVVRFNMPAKLDSAEVRIQW